MRLRLILAITSVLFIGLSEASQRINLLDPKLSQFENVYSYGQAKFVNGELHLISPKNWFFTTKQRYDNFILSADIKMPQVKEYNNSGIIFRGQIEQDADGQRVVGYQAEIDPSERRWSGGLFDQGRRKWLYPLHPKRSNRDDDFIKSYLPPWSAQQGSVYKPGEWNNLRIVCDGPSIKIYLNGVLTTYVEDTKDKRGVIGLQHHGSKLYKESGHSENVVRFKNIFIEKLN
ncbi:3-keto-disaccharide hydrolase [Pseudoalteromonas sp. ZZD1]|uniref:3-keto-disaccharide hydrolase n=1 Tax=Pseudoalteromonas sp. ZZD1 TaxID=3139395 RepID=UPI003BAC94A2